MKRLLVTVEELKLKKDEVDIYYKTYVNNFKRALSTNEESIEQAVNDGLLPGKNQNYVPNKRHL